MKILLKNVDLYTPEHVGIKDILIDDSVIIKIDNQIICNDCEIINCNGNIICPMFVDGHEHLFIGVNHDYWSTEGIMKSGIGTIVGCLANEQSYNDVDKLINIINDINSSNLITAYCLAGSKNYVEDTTNYILNNKNVIGIKTALFQPQRPKPNLSYEKLKQDAIRTYNGGLKSGKSVQVHIHLDHPFSGRNKETIENINSGHLDNLHWIDKIVEETSVPYSLFKLTHAQKYYDRILEYANKGCFIDYTAFSGDYDTRFDCLVKAIKDKSVDLSKISISSDLGIMITEQGHLGEETPISLLNTIRKLALEKGLLLEDILKMVTSNPAILINKDCGIIKENSPYKLLMLDIELNINSIINHGEIIELNAGEQFTNHVKLKIEP